MESVTFLSVKIAFKESNYYDIALCLFSCCLPKKHIYKTLGLIVVLFCLNSGYAQGIDRRTEFSPTSPNASEIMRHGLTPVNQYTGIPDINIPLTSIDFDGKIIPINLRYHAGGIRTNQESSWIGLGWSLTSNAIISRRINLKSDIGTRKVGFNAIFHGYCNLVDSIPSQIDQSYLNVLNAPGETSYDKKDTQPDIFTASLFGEVVKFQLTQKIINGTIEAIILNDSKAKIEYNEQSRNFTITDDEGFVYEFNQKEYVSNFAAKNTNGRLISDIFSLSPGTVSWNDRLDTDIITSWFSDKIISPNGKVLDLNYHGDNSQVRNANEVEDLYLSVSPTFVFESKSIGACQGDGIYFTTGDTPSYSYQRSIQENRYVREIVDKSNGNRIVFKIGEREDIIGFDPNKHGGVTRAIYYGEHVKLPKKLTKIEVYSSAGKQIKQILFHQSYFNNDKITEVDEEIKANYLRLKLDSISIDNSIYKFGYEQENMLPAKNTAGQDFWGFYNGQDSGYRYPTILLTNSMSLGNCIDDLSAYPSGKLINGGKRGSNFGFGKIGTLTKLIYPTGGYSLFNYETNTARVSNNPESGDYSFFSSMLLSKNNLESRFPLNSTSDSYLKTYGIGGLRIESTINYDQAENQLLKKTYHYDDSYGSSIPMSSGRLMDDLFYYFPVEGYFQGDYFGTNLILSSSNKVHGINAAQGNHIGYDRVEEKQVNSTNAENGKIATYFRNIPNKILESTQFGNVSLDAPPFTFEEGNGKILQQNIYDNIFGSIPKREITNTYQYTYSDIANAFKVYYSDIGVVISSESLSGTNSEVYDWFFYKTRRSYASLSQTIVKENFELSNSIVNVTNYTYNNKPQIKSKTKITSLGNTTREEYYYPYDQSYGVSNLDNMSDLQWKNRISQPVYIRKYNNDRLTGHELIAYTYYKNLLLPSSIGYQKEEGTLSQIEARIIYEDYDEAGNILEYYAKNGPIIKYLWGYERKYPIAKITNVPSTATPLNEIVDEALILNAKTPETLYFAEIGKLRNHPDFQNSEVLSYTFDPQVGMTGVTDGKGSNLFYAYDDKERLVSVKNNDNKLISENKYNLVNESTTCLTCDPVIFLTSSAYALFANQDANLTVVIPSGIPAIQRWELYLGNGIVQQGDGMPSGNYVVNYTSTGVKPVRMYVYFSDGTFITGNINFRVFTGTIPGGDVYFTNIQNGTTGATSAQIYGDPGTVITYYVDCNGSTSELTGLAHVGGQTTNTTQPEAAIYKTITIPTSGYLDCDVQTYPGTNTLGSGGTNVIISTTTVGQIINPSSITHSYSNQY